MCNIFRCPWEKWAFKKSISIAKLCNITELQHKEHAEKKGAILFKHFCILKITYYNIYPENSFLRRVMVKSRTSPAQDFRLLVKLCFVTFLLLLLLRQKHSKAAQLGVLGAPGCSWGVRVHFGAHELRAAHTPGSSRPITKADINSTLRS